MSDDFLPAPGGKLTPELFAHLAVVAAESCSGVTLVLTAVDDQDAQLGELFVVEDVPVDTHGQLAALSRVVSKWLGSGTALRLRVAYAFVQEVSAGVVTVEVAIRDLYRIDGLN
jgi:hypothetical protein